MSDEPFLPFPKAREFWEEKTGSLFFIKWMIASGIYVVSTLASRMILLKYTSDPNLPPKIIAFAIPAFLPAVVLFGFRWRALVWGIVLVILEAANSPFPETGSWPRWYIPIALTALLQTPLLISVRHWPWLWFVAYSIAQSIAFRIEHSLFGHTAWVRLLSLGLSGEMAQAVVYCAPQMIAAAILGLALICLMPPTKMPGETKASNN